MGSSFNGTLKYYWDIEGKIPNNNFQLYSCTCSDVKVKNIKLKKKINQNFYKTNSLQKHKNTGMPRDKDFKI